MTFHCKSNSDFPQYVYPVVFIALEQFLAICYVQKSIISL